MTESAGLEIWAGIECTVNRVKSAYNCQCSANGHLMREHDLERFAALGIKRIRYPILWEWLAPERPDRIDWSWSDERLRRLRELKVEPILGLLHHGSGPRYTSLIDPSFPEKFEAYATRVAERYPWATWYTPINEPLTTARFSCLYGVWYPHERANPPFARSLINQMKATVLAMRAIRRIQPNAVLLQTDDMGRAAGTEPLARQVALENERRWLAFDLLLGKVDYNHPMREYLIQKGQLTEGELEWFIENQCPPDVIGINHYPLSNRFLDHRLHLYPKRFHGGNDSGDRYADVGAVDCGQTTPPSPEDILGEVWERYRRPIAVTEAHIAGGRESQMRWLDEIWTSAVHLRERGADIRAVTAWSLLGSFDWNSLCTTKAGFYESGIFDVRSPKPRATALAKMISDYSARGETAHPLLEQPGYWHRPERVLFAPESDLSRAHHAAPLKPSRPIIITGASGTLGRAFARLCQKRGLEFRLLSRDEMDIASDASVRECLRGIKPWAIINAAGYVRVDDAEGEPERCHRENARGPETLALACRDFNLPLVTFSSDLVFDGKRDTPYRESHAMSPLNVYGRSKAEGEERVLNLTDRSLVIRTSSFFGPWDEHNFVHHAERVLRSGHSLEAANDITISPTYVPDLVNASLDLLIDGLTGRVHLSNQGAVTWLEWAERIARRIGVPSERVVSRSSAFIAYRATRPRYTVLESELHQLMPAFEDAFERHYREVNR